MSSNSHVSCSRYDAQMLCIAILCACRHNLSMSCQCGVSQAAASLSDAGKGTRLSPAAWERSSQIIVVELQNLELREPSRPGWVEGPCERIADRRQKPARRAAVQ